MLLQVLDRLWAPRNNLPLHIAFGAEMADKYKWSLTTIQSWVWECMELFFYTHPTYVVMAPCLIKRIDTFIFKI